MGANRRDGRPVDRCRWGDPTVSAYVAAALEEKAKLDDLAALLDEMLAASGGPLTDDEGAAADAVLDG